MNNEQAKSIALYIDKTILAPMGVNFQRSDNGDSISHLRWMVQMIDGGMPEDKAMRWLGYIQGCLVWGGQTKLSEMKELNQEIALIPETSPFKEGDKVYLKSGSPKMTIVKVDIPNKRCRCLWIMYGSDKLNDEYIPLNALREA